MSGVFQVVLAVFTGPSTMNKGPCKAACIGGVGR